MIQLGSLAEKKREPVWNGGFTLCGCFFSVNGCFFSENCVWYPDIVCMRLNGLAGKQRNHPELVRKKEARGAASRFENGRVSLSAGFL